MKAIVVTDQAAGPAGMTLVERPKPSAAINDVVRPSLSTTTARSLPTTPGLRPVELARHGVLTGSSAAPRRESPEDERSPGDRTGP
jgi:hypothetical protein